MRIIRFSTVTRLTWNLISPLRLYNSSKHYCNNYSTTTCDSAIVCSINIVIRNVVDVRAYYIMHARLTYFFHSCRVQKISIMKRHNLVYRLFGIPTMFEEMRKSNINLFLSFLLYIFPLGLNTYIYYMYTFLWKLFFLRFLWKKKRIITFKLQRLPPDVFCQTPGILKWYFTLPIPPPLSGQTNNIHRICMDVAQYSEGLSLASLR